CAALFSQCSSFLFLPSDAARMGETFMEPFNDHHFTKDHIAYLVEELRLSSLDNETSERARVALFEPINLEVYRKAIGPKHVPCKYCAAVTVPPLATCHRCWEVVQRINKQVLHRWAATESGREFLCELEQLVTSAQNVAASHVEETEVVDSLKKPRKKRDTTYLVFGN